MPASWPGFRVGYVVARSAFQQLMARSDCRQWRVCSIHSARDLWMVGPHPFGQSVALCLLLESGQIQIPPHVYRIIAVAESASLKS
jgi:hypothetical protein